MWLESANTSMFNNEEEVGQNAAHHEDEAPDKEEEKLKAAHRWWRMHWFLFSHVKECWMKDSPEVPGIPVPNGYTLGCSDNLTC